MAAHASDKIAAVAALQLTVVHFTTSQTDHSHTATD